MYSQERKFVLTANDQMQVLEEIWAAEPQENTNSAVANSAMDSRAVQPAQERTITALHSIKFAANSVQARGVYRAANFCETIYSNLAIHSNLESDCGPRLRGSLAGLKSLIFQYADGLFEIDPEFKASIQSREIIQDTVDDYTHVATDYNDNQEAILLQEKHTQAGHVLKPLLSLVGDDKNRHALETLMTFEAKPREEQPKPSAIQTPSTTPRIAIKFENLMSPITSLVLSEARHQGKQVSISYAADFDELGLSMANRVQEFLEVLCLAIVANGVPTKQSTQISLTGQALENKYVFSVNWRGYDVQDIYSEDIYSEGTCREDNQFNRELAKLRGEGGEIAFRKLALDVPQKDAPQEAGQTPLMQNLEVTFQRVQAKRHATNAIFTLKPENVIKKSQGATG